MKNFPEFSHKLDSRFVTDNVSMSISVYMHTVAYPGGGVPTHPHPSASILYLKNFLNRKISMFMLVGHPIKICGYATACNACTSCLQLQNAVG